MTDEARLAEGARNLLQRCGEFAPGSVTIVKAYTRHRDYVTKAWAKSPIADVLARIRGVEPVDVASVNLGF